MPQFVKTAAFQSTAIFTVHPFFLIRQHPNCSRCNQTAARHAFGISLRN